MRESVGRSCEGEVVNREQVKRLRVENGEFVERPVDSVVVRRKVGVYENEGPKDEEVESRSEIERLLTARGNAKEQ